MVGGHDAHRAVCAATARCGSCRMPPSSLARVPEAVREVDFGRPPHRARGAVMGSATGAGFRSASPASTSTRQTVAPLVTFASPRSLAANLIKNILVRQPVSAVKPQALDMASSKCCPHPPRSPVARPPTRAQCAGRHCAFATRRASVASAASAGLRPGCSARRALLVRCASRPASLTPRPRAPLCAHA